MASTIPLSQAIEALRGELEKSMKAGQDHDLRFQVQEVKLELQVTAATTGSGDARVKWFLFEAGGEVMHESARAQTVTLTLKAVTPKPGGPAGLAPDLALLSGPED
ncbi:MAG: hypothetical protein LBK54_06795 [Propionibacteriaceae bacterium]|nr:hypothetical protein [Propionibacteriaceae bacterium]